MNEIQTNFRKEMGLSVDPDKLTNCKICNGKIAKGVKKCPHCGKDQRNFFVRHKIITVISILFLIGIIGNAFNHGNYANQASVSKLNTEQQKVSLPQIGGEVFSNPDLILTAKGSGANEVSQYTTGTIKNVSNRNYSYVEVDINLYDVNGNQIGSTLDNVNNLEAGHTWSFKAYDNSNNVKKYKIMNIWGR